MVTRVKSIFKGLQCWTLINLRSLPVFGTQLDSMKCTKLLARRMHGRSLWLDKEYPIHVDYIQHLIGFSVTWNAVSSVF